MKWKITLVIALIYGVWTGFDSIRVNIQSPDVHEITMRELESR